MLVEADECYDTDDDLQEQVEQRYREYKEHCDKGGLILRTINEEGDGPVYLGK